jgi:hypothetical protein
MFLYCKIYNSYTILTGVCSCWVSSLYQFCPESFDRAVICYEAFTRTRGVLDHVTFYLISSCIRTSTRMGLFCVGIGCEVYIRLQESYQLEYNPCSLLTVKRCFGRTCHLHLQGQIILIWHTPDRIFLDDGTPVSVIVFGSLICLSWPSTRACAYSISCLNIAVSL